jgi:hypothetical protein
MSADSVLRRLAAIAILVAGGTHFDLWLEHGYRHVHVIGPLFLLNAVSAAVFALLLAWRGGTLVELAGLGYAAATLTAFFVSVYHGLFGFVEVLDGTAQTIAALAEGTALVLLALSLARSGATAPGRRWLTTATHRHLEQRRIHGA